MCCWCTVCYILGWWVVEKSLHAVEMGLLPVYRDGSNVQRNAAMSRHVCKTRCGMGSFFLLVDDSWPTLVGFAGWC